MSITIYPQNAVHELRRTVYQAERYYSNDLTEAVTFGTRPLWKVSLDWGLQSPDVADRIVGEIAEVATIDSEWKLFIPIYPGVTPLFENSKVYHFIDPTMFTSDSFRYYALGLTEKLGQLKSGQVVQIGKWALRVTVNKAINDDGTFKSATPIAKVQNMPKALLSMSSTQRRELDVKYGRGEYTIMANVEGGNPPAVERLSSEVSRVLPIVISEVA